MAATEQVQELVRHEPTAADDDEIRAVVLDYYEGWFGGDALRIERALHPELAKRSLWLDLDGDEVLRTTTAARMVELTAAGAGADESHPRVELEIAVHGAISSVTARGGPYVDFLHLARTRAGWKIVNAIWAWRDLTRRS